MYDQGVVPPNRTVGGLSMLTIWNSGILEFWNSGILHFGIGVFRGRRIPIDALRRRQFYEAFLLALGSRTSTIRRR